MSWWLIPLIIIVVIAGVGAGLLVSYYILKRQNKSFPIFQKQNSMPEIPVTVEKRPTPTSKPRLITKIEPRKEKTVQTQAKSITLAEDTLEKYISKSKSSQANISPVVPEKSSQITTSSVVPEKSFQPAKPPVVPYKSVAIIELESNLGIAKLPTAEKLASFKTDVWNTRRSEFNLASSQLLSELTEAYVDMLLANNIVWLVTELGRDSKDLRESYSDLKGKVAQRLERVLPQVRESLK